MFIQLKSTLLLLVCVLLFGTILRGQYQGGDEDGYTMERYLGKLNGFSLVELYQGGSGDGFDKSGQGSFVQGLDIAMRFKGGDDDGYAMERFLGNLSGQSLLPLYSGGPGDGFDKSGSNSFFRGTPFPVTLLTFDAFPENEFVIIRWVTESEQNQDFFTIERSQDAREFADLMEVPGLGSPLSPQAYRETDPQPYSGRSYYRLKSSDFDGSFTYSQVVEVNLESTAAWGFHLYPNPTSGQSLTLSLSGLGDAYEIQIEVIDMQGKSIYSDYVSPQSTNIEIALDLKNRLTAGSYLVRASSGDHQMSKLLIVTQ